MRWAYVAPSCPHLLGLFIPRPTAQTPSMLLPS